MIPTLMLHQQEGVRFLLEKRSGLLAFEQGLGKTLVAIESFSRAKSDHLTKHLLVVCPNSLKRNWLSEIEKFAPQLTTLIVEGNRHTRRSQLASSKADVVITSYETARSEVTALIALLRRAPTAVVFDESHATKNKRSLTSTAAMHLSQHATHRWLLSGTPITNSPEDLYTQVQIISPGKNPLGSYDHFLACTQDPSSRPEMIGKLEKLLLRRTKEQCLDLPEKIFVDIRVELPDWQRKLYDDMRMTMVCAIRGMSGDQYKAFAKTALSQLTKLMQLASNPSLIIPDIPADPGKFKEIDYLLRDALGEPSRKIILWSNYVRTIQQLAERYKEYAPLTLYGGTPTEDRQTVASKFQDQNAHRLLIANPAAAGTGFTLTAATMSLYETLSWRYDFFAQSQDRNHRIGQAFPVTYLRVVASDTIEEAIVAAVERKSDMARNLLGDPTTSLAISRLSREEMCALLEMNRLPA